MADANDRDQVLAREKRFALLAGLASIAGVALILVTFGDSAAAVRTSEGIAERFRELDAESGRLMLASILQALGWLLLGVPLIYLFKAAEARASRVRKGLIGLIVVAPLFLAVGSVLSAVAVTGAASDFVATPNSEYAKCIDEKQNGATTGANAEGGDQNGQGATGEDGATGGQGSQGGEGVTRAEATTECQNEAARELRTASSLAGFETGFGLAGLLGFTIAVVYTALWGLRTGLLPRFWGSLGIALGAVFVFFTLFTLVWFVYLGFLLAGWVPGGRPPAWASGQAEPWPKGGSLFGGRSPEEDEAPAADGEVIEGEAEEMPEAGELPQGDPPPELRKRKKRDA
jgi:hypothetical protein